MLKRTAVYVGTLALGLSGVLAGAAQAAPRSTPLADTAPVRMDTTSVSGKEQRAARSFWSTERMRAAREATPPATGSVERDSRSSAGNDDGRPAVEIPPLKAKGSPHATSTPTSTSTSASTSEASADATSPTRWTGGGLVARTAGRVFFSRADGGLFTCSASAVNSANKSTLLTAGHCVVDASTGEVYRNWVFVPGYAEGKRPFGTFTAAQLLHDADYVSSGGNLNYDYAFVVVSRYNTRPLGDVVGGLGLSFNTAAPGMRVHSFGYGGSEAEGRHEWMNHCEGDQYADEGRADSTMLGIGCVQTGGSSGGPFLADFDPATGAGQAVGAISASAGGSEYYAPLRGSAETIYREAETLDGGNTGEIAHSAGKCLDVPSGDSTNGNKVQLWGCNDSGAQQWYVGSRGTIEALGKCLEVPDGATADGTLLQIWECDGGANQRFTLSDAGEIVAQETGKCLQNADGDRVSIAPCNESIAQRWTVSGHDNGGDPRFNEIVDSRGTCVDVPSSNPANGNKVQLWGCNGSGAQHWYVGSRGTVQALGRCLEVPDGATADGTLLQIWECDGGANQRFTVTDAGEIVAQGTNKCVETADPGTTWGSGVKIAPCDGSQNQRWTVRPVA
ncbi:ricin-type beta-trefoil lectin domain protein [Streptomyces sp. RK76]|uniref:ricin-type beta-trefoil lectin domain protein n=1 Tax=Streptomyces sp. RK76 TaxID=2824896 RepID=UPI001B397B3C|nr:ricin-type beta-trefoil lectin domain protein [Streptomyces sp. RK76]MBQ0951287.1 ricin-type beta-trefoil lectin domain protein [Streptomyces sp. RK76]